jgi:hypothetical protein
MDTANLPSIPLLLLKWSRDLSDVIPPEFACTAWQACGDVYIWEHEYLPPNYALSGPLHQVAQLPLPVTSSVVSAHK